MEGGLSLLVSSQRELLDHFIPKISLSSVQTFIFSKVCHHFMGVFNIFQNNIFPSGYM